MEVNSNPNLYKLFMESKPASTETVEQTAQSTKTDESVAAQSLSDKVTLSQEAKDLSNGLITPNTAGGTTLPPWPPKKENQ